jgi:polar amino acid transport system substrate-binding protein
MNNKKYLVMVVLLVGAFILGACGSANTAAPAEAAPAAAASAAISEPTYDDKGLPVYGCLGSADTALVDLNCREVTIAVENAYLPFNYIDEKTGKAGGWDYTVIPEICNLLHCTPVFQECSWDILIQSVADGLYDMGADGVTNNADRQKIVDFSDTYISIDQRLLVNKGETRFASIEEFVAIPDLKIGVQSGTTNYETAVKYVPEARISAFEQYPFAVQSLLSKDVDAVLIDEQAGIGYIKENPDALEFVGPSISSDNLAFLYPKGSELVTPFNQALQALKDNGRLAEINTQFFGFAD